VIGLMAFLQPFWSRLAPSVGQFTPRSQETPLVLTVLVGLCFAALLVEVQGQSVNARVIATLGVLVAMISALRFLEVAVPGPGGFSPVFAPIILAGYVFGAGFGFMLGAFTFLVSGLITGGVGPWLPYQMFTAGWVGMSAGWLGRWMNPRQGRGAVLILALFGFLWGLVFGAIMNVYFWPFAAGPADQSWQPGSGVLDALRRYGLFYLATSLWWDVIRGLGSAVLVMVLGVPTLRALMRFRNRFQFDSRPFTPAAAEEAGE
jgi:energy-coupling factor transport system substrate-specific component